MLNITTLKFIIKWLLISLLIGIGSGTASALFLISLEWATQTRLQNSWLLLLLPLGGIIIGTLYNNWGKSVEKGNNLLIDEFHNPKKVIPLRMAPLVLIGTILTHLFGGSAGREGTAVQMGGSIADQLTHYFKLNNENRKIILMAGMSGGFGSVFGVPLAGMIFGLEVLTIGKLQIRGLLTCALSSFTAHHTTLFLGAHHTIYYKPSFNSELDLKIILSVLFAGVLFGFVARLFTSLTEVIARFSKTLITSTSLRLFMGGLLLSSLFYSQPWTTRYAGLGVPVIVSSIEHSVLYYDWIWKLALTAFTLGVGFKGGEVTPLLFIGATLGNALSFFLPIPLPILSAVGFVGVFAGAANTPIACTLMAIEIFGMDVGLLAGLACFSSYFSSGHRGIYSSQTVHFQKTKTLRKLFRK